MKRLVMVNSVSHPKHILHTILADYKLAFLLYRRNFLPIFGVLFLGIIIKEILDIIFLQWLSIYLFLPFSSYLNQVIFFLIHLPGDSVYFGFFGACVGMCHDIMSSGDQFTQLHRFATYLKRYWLIYFGLSFFINLPLFSTYLLKIEWLSPGLFLLLWFITISWWFLIIETNPAVLVRKNLGQALKDNFRILRSHGSRVILTFSVLVVVFSLPRITLQICELFYENVFSLNQLTFIKWAQDLIRWIYTLIGHPLIAFLTIGIYNEYIGFTTQPIENA